MSPFNSILTIFLLAWSKAFCIAIGTSLAFPLPKPIFPFPSPTTVTAVNPKIRPPLTTLATLFTWTNFSSKTSDPRLSVTAVFSIFFPKMRDQLREPIQLEL